MADPAADRVEVFRSDEGLQYHHPYPWQFRVWFGGKCYLFAGLPNKCETRRQAAIRGWWRLRWLRDGSYWTRYR